MDAYTCNAGRALFEFGCRLPQRTFSGFHKGKTNEKNVPMTALTLSLFLQPFNSTMKYTILLALLVACQASAVDLETVVATENDDEVVEFVNADEVNGNSTLFPLTDEETIVIIKEDNWEAEGSNWNPDGEDTREGNGGATDAVFQVGDPEVESKFQVFHGRDASLSLATAHGRGGGARGHARGQGHGNNRKRTLKALRGSRK
jgi:hypothetical protein